MGVFVPILVPDPAAGIIAAITFLSVSGTFPPCRNELKKRAGYKPNSVSAKQIMIIYLGCRSPGTSCNLPGNIGRAVLKRFSIWSCTRWGLPCPPRRRGSGELLPHHFNLTCSCLKAGHRRCLFCGTFLRLPGVRVTNHRALQCSDFPLRHFIRSDHAPAQSLILCCQFLYLPAHRPWNSLPVERGQYPNFLALPNNCTLFETGV